MCLRMVGIGGRGAFQHGIPRAYQRSILPPHDLVCVTKWKGKGSGNKERARRVRQWERLGRTADDFNYKKS